MMRGHQQCTSLVKMRAAQSSAARVKAALRARSLNSPAAHPGQPVTSPLHTPVHSVRDCLGPGQPCATCAEQQCLAPVAAYAGPLHSSTPQAPREATKTRHAGALMRQTHNLVNQCAIHTASHHQWVQAGGQHATAGATAACCSHNTKHTQAVACTTPAGACTVPPTPQTQGCGPDDAGGRAS